MSPKKLDLGGPSYQNVQLPNAAVTSLITVGIAAVGQWSKGEKLTIELAIGALGMAVGLAIMSEFLPRLAAGIALLALVSVSLVYVKPIVKKLGLVD